jgi:Zn-dependent peptidase ImmA (M78 family)/DNA-binding XRE family transcriptional regulator
MELRIGERLRQLRERCGVTQEKLREVMGFEHRQTIGQIENGDRRVTIEELMKALEFFEMSLDEFTNPFIPMVKHEFSWRRSETDEKTLMEFQDNAREWIGAYQELGRTLGETPSALRSTLDLTPKSSFEQCFAAGEAMAQQLGLGDQPAKALADVIQHRLGVLVLMVDATPGISGAASRLPDLNVALVNRRESEGRRNFDLAHELFHLLTWKTMTPSWIDGEPCSMVDAAREKEIKRIEQLADKFAAGILMPRYAISKLGSPQGDIVAWVNAQADHLGVSAPALKWQLVNLGILPELASIDDSRFRQASKAGAASFPPLFNEGFATRIAQGINRGLISVRRAAGLTNLTIEALGALFDTYKIVRPSTMGGPLQSDSPS